MGGLQEGRTTTLHHGFTQRTPNIPIEGELWTPKLSGAEIRGVVNSTDSHIMKELRLFLFDIVWKITSIYNYY